MASPIYTTGDPVWNSLEDSTRVPLTSELESGWPCGEVDKELLNFVSGHGWNQIHNMLVLSGFTPSIPNLHQLAQAIQSGKVNYAVPAGTANALTATLAPVPVSWLSLSGASIHLMISTANTATGVTLNVNGLGAKAVVYNDGTLPQPGDLVGLVELAYNPVLDKVQIMSLSRNATLNVKRSTLVADRGASTQLTGNGVTTKITGYGTVTSYFAGGSTFAAGVLTIGPADAGLWYISGHCRQPFAGVSGMNINLHINGNATPTITDGGATAVSGSTAHGSCSRIMVLAAGDTVEMRVLQTTGGDVFFNDLYSLTTVRLGNS